MVCASTTCIEERGGIFFDFFVAWSRYLRYNGADNGFSIGWCI